jgi:hypothetical protein
MIRKRTASRGRAAAVEVVHPAASGRPPAIVRVLAAAVALLCCGPVAPLAGASSPAHRPLASAHAAGAIRIDDTAHLHLLKAFGSVLLEEGYAGGSLPGVTRVRMSVGSSVSASFSVRTRSGTIYGYGHASLHSSGRYASFGGWLSVSKGSGRYSHARGSGKLYGVIDRRTHALTVQTIGTLRY